MKELSLNKGIVLHGVSYNYTIERVLGHGTFGITYLAKVQMKGALGSLDANVNVAIKEFFMRDFNGRDECSVTYSSKDGAFAYYKSKFIHEAENLSRLDNPGIIKVIELFEENQTAYYVMEYQSNGSFDEYIATIKHLPPRASIGYALQISEALQYMHDRRMLHLDLKPSNIMMNNEKRLVLIDFGLSKRFDQWGNPETSTTIGHGTPGYAPIEQAHYQGTKEDGFPAAMDVYALGATMFKMLTGHRPPEASIILNEGFPVTELESANTPDSLIEVVRTCMEPLRKNRYKSVKDVSAALLSAGKLIEGDEDTEFATKGFYKKAVGDKEYGTYQIKLIPVTSSIKFPDYLRIRLWDNSKKGKSYEVIMTDGHFDDGYYSLLRIWDKGEFIDDHKFAPGIPKDVKDFIISQGLLSTEHWENEETTSPVDNDFGTDVSIVMSNCGKEPFVRRVKHAHKDWHSFLLETILELLHTTSLSNVLIQAQNNKHKLNHEIFKAPSDTKSISVSFKPCRIGSSFRGVGYQYKVRHKIDSDLIPIIKEFNNLNIEIGEEIKDSHDYSEEPGELAITIESGSKGSILLSLVAFNTDICAGNIYNADINELAHSIEQILLKHIPKRTEPTRELIYSIPDSVSEIGIEYSDGGAVGLARLYRLRIGVKTISTVSSDSIYFCNPDEFHKLKAGLRQLELRSQENLSVDPPTGQTFETLSISLYGNDGDLIKKFYAQDDGEKPIGNIAIEVDKLKSEIARLSPSFEKSLLEFFGSEKVKPKQSSWVDVIWMAALFSIVICVFASPTYFFVKSTDDCFIWLWLTIGITELFSGILFSIGGRFKRTSGISNFETVCFIIGILALIAYIVLWIFQMIFWWG